MAKFRLLIPLLFLLLLSLFLVACNDQPEITLDPLPLVSSTLPDTTTEPPVSSTVAETTEDPYLPGTPGLEFDERADGTALVVGIVDVTAKEIRIPNYTPDGVRVIGIAHNAFSMNQTIETLILSKSVFSIEGGAFYGCTALREIKFAEGLESIAPTAFQNCTSLLSLAEDWPWWCVSEYSVVKSEIQADPRWNKWVAKLQQ